MPAQPEVADPLAAPYIEERVLPEWEEQSVIDNDGPYVVILYNDDHHGFDEVILQIQKATGYDVERCARVMLEAHTRGRAIAYTGTEESCERAATILRQIRLQVETDKY